MSRLFDRLRHAWTSQRGYTMVELIASMTIFAIVIMSATAVFIKVGGASTKAGAQRKVQQDARYSVEDIARQIRSSAINYAFYAKAASQATPCALDAGGKTNLLAVDYTQAAADKSPVTQHLYIYYDPAGKALYRWLQPENQFLNQAPSCGEVIAQLRPSPPGDPEQYRITGPNVEVPSAAFVVQPLQNPNPGDSSYATISNYNQVHPRVTVMLQTTTRDYAAANGITATNEKSSVTLQTTVSSRAYPLDKLYGQPVAPAPPPPPPPLTSWSATGWQPKTCVQLRPGDVCAQDGSAIYSNIGGDYSPGTFGYGPWELSYETTTLAAKTYTFRLDYANRPFSNLPVPPNYRYAVKIYLDGNLISNAQLPATGGNPTGAAVGTFTVPNVILGSSGVHTVKLSWSNDSFDGAHDTNLAIHLVGLQ